MPKIQDLIIVFCFLLLSGCAQIHSGNFALPVDSNGNVTDDASKIDKIKLIISGEENRNLESTYFGVIDFTIENPTQKWIRITDIKIYFGDDNKNRNVSFTSGSDLANWYKSTQKRLDIDQYNKNLALGILSGVGFGMMAYSADSNTQKAGAGVLLGTATSLTVDAFNNKLSELEKSKIFPENHLFAGNVSIPPGLFVKRFLVLNSQNHEQTGYIRYLYIEYKTDQGDTEKVKLDFRHFLMNSKWQYDVRLKK